MRGVTSLVPTERKSPRNLWRWPPRKIAGRGGVLIVLEEKHGPIREVKACREAGVGGFESWRWQTRVAANVGAVACAAGGGLVCASERRTAGRTRVGSGLSPITRGYGAETDQGPSFPGGRNGRLRSTPAPTGAAGGREPWALLGAAAPPLRAPRFRPRPGSGRDRGRAAPSACAWELPPPVRAPVRRAHRPREGRPSGPGDLRHTPETLSELDAGRSRLAPRFASAGDGPLGTCGRSGAGTRRGYDRRLPPERYGRENGASGASFLSQTRSNTGGPDPQRGRAGTS